MARGWGGIENLSLIPGSVGAAPIQNIGAYGAQLSDVFVDLQAVPLDGGEPRTMDGAACAFGYRDSVFKHGLRDRMLITQVRLRLRTRPRAEPGVCRGARGAGAVWGSRHPTVADVSRAVVRLRRRKLPDPETRAQRRLVLQESRARRPNATNGSRAALSAARRRAGRRRVTRYRPRS